MEKKKYGIFKMTDTKNSVMWVEADNFDILTGTAVLVFKDKAGAVLCVHHLPEGHYVTTI